LATGWIKFAFGIPVAVAAGRVLGGGLEVIRSPISGSVRVEGPFGALVVLMDEWPDMRGPGYVRARCLCRAAIAGRKDAEKARDFSHRGKGSRPVALATLLQCLRYGESMTISWDKPVELVLSDSATAAGLLACALANGTWRNLREVQRSVHGGDRSGNVANRCAYLSF